MCFMYVLLLIEWRSKDIIHNGFGDIVSYQHTVQTVNAKVSWKAICKNETIQQIV